MTILDIDEMKGYLPIKSKEDNSIIQSLLNDTEAEILSYFPAPTEANLALYQSVQREAVLIKFTANKTRKGDNVRLLRDLNGVYNKIGRRFK